MIAEKIWNIDVAYESNIVDVYINFLRKKIDKDYNEKIIKTIRGIGYIINEEVQLEILIKNFILEIIIPLVLYLYAISYGKQKDANQIPEKGGFRTKYSTLNIENWRFVNELAYRVTIKTVKIEIVIVFVSMLSLILRLMNPTLNYVVVVFILLLLHII